jgi:gluconate 2-dehydrogenase gamma chain
MSNVNRREAIAVMTGLTGAAVLSLSPDEIARAARQVAGLSSGALQTPQFFDEHEWQTLRLLVDLILPQDERSGSATDAGVPEFIDFIMMDGDEDRRTAMRGGLAWLDTECRERFPGKNFLDCSEDERAAVLNDIAFPASAPAHLSHGVQWFTSLRNFTASGFWSSKMGVEDLQYIGNVAVPEWTGCPVEQLRRLGVG